MERRIIVLQWFENDKKRPGMMWSPLIAVS